MSQLARIIVDRLTVMGMLDPEDFHLDTAAIYRLYPGYWQRSEGAWSWLLKLDRKDGGNHSVTFGSQHTATECAYAKHWAFYTTGPDHGIIPGEKP